MLNISRETFVIPWNEPELEPFLHIFLAINFHVSMIRYISNKIEVPKTIIFHFPMSTFFIYPKCSIYVKASSVVLEKDIFVLVFVHIFKYIVQCCMKGVREKFKDILTSKLVAAKLFLFK